MAENVKVIVRCRPMNRREQDMKCKNIIRISDCAVHLENPADATAPAKTFTFDSAYDWQATSETLYNDICYALVENVLEGYNATIFAYGQTGCGKSHTMQGPDDPPANSAAATAHHREQRGIIPRSFDHIFEAISVATGVRYLALVSYLEIYNENIRDLLAPNTPSSQLVLQEQPGAGIAVQNLSQHTVHTAADCEHLLRQGAANRIVGATLMNASSSRSHSIFTISLEQIATAGGDEPQRQQPDSELLAIKKGKLNLVDLAGSERQAKTGAAGDRLKEATKINLSLSALGNVISALVDGRRGKHIPYRDSRLTRLLQDSLGGNTKTLMVACVSPAGYNYDETLSTLRYASRAKSISNKPTINEDPKEAMLREYQLEISKLRRLLADGGGGGEGQAISGDGAKDFEAEQLVLRQRYEMDAERLRSEADVQRREKEELVKDMAELRVDYDRQVAELAKAQLMGKTTKQLAETEERRLAVEEQTRAVQSKVAALRSDLIGGERANDLQLREKHKKKKAAAARRLSALSRALGRIEHSDDRDALQTHYTDIQHELTAKTEALRTARQRVRALEREVADVQSEFQLDRADYLESIRRLQKRLKFYEQLCEKAGQQRGLGWDPDAIRAESQWNDDTARWRIPDGALHAARLRLPPAVDETTMTTKTPSSPITCKLRSGSSSVVGTRAAAASTSAGGSERSVQSSSQKLERSEGRDIAGSYFRPRRAAALLQSGQQRQPATLSGAWKSTLALAGTSSGAWLQPTHNHHHQQPTFPSTNRGQMTLSRTWNGPTSSHHWQQFSLNGGATSPTSDRDGEAADGAERRRRLTPRQPPAARDSSRAPPASGGTAYVH